MEEEEKEEEDEERELCGDGEETTRVRVSAFEKRRIIITVRVWARGGEEGWKRGEEEGEDEGDGVIAELSEEEDDDDDDDDATGWPSSIVSVGKRFTAVTDHPFSSSTPAPLSERERSPVYDDGLLPFTSSPVCLVFCARLADRSVRERRSTSSRTSTAV